MLRLYTVAFAGMMKESQARDLANIGKALIPSADVVLLEGEVRIPDHTGVTTKSLTEAGGFKPKPFETERY